MVSDDNDTVTRRMASCDVVAHSGMMIPLCGAIAALISLSQLN